MWSSQARCNVRCRRLSLYVAPLLYYYFSLRVLQTLCAEYRRCAKVFGDVLTAERPAIVIDELREYLGMPPNHRLVLMLNNPDELALL